MSSGNASGRGRALRLLTAIGTALLVSNCAGSPGGQTSPPQPETAQSSTAAASTTEQTPDSSPSSSPSVAATGSAAADPLVEDFPTELIPVLDGSEVLVSDVKAAGDAAAVSLVAVTEAPAAKVLDYYDGVLSTQGFEALEGSSIDGTASKTYARGAGMETVNISAVETDGRTTYTIGAHVSAESVELGT